MIKVKISYIIALIIMIIFYNNTNEYIIFLIIVSLSILFVLNIIITIIIYFNINIEIDNLKKEYMVGDEISFILKVSISVCLLMGFIEINLPIESRGKFESNITKKIIALRKPTKENFSCMINRRGVFNIKNCEIVISSFIPILSIKKQITVDHSAYVYPRIYDIDLLEIKNMKSDFGKISTGFNTSDIFSIKSVRKYEYGDSLRNINWKTSAKIGNLMVKEYESKNDSNVIIVIDMSNEGTIEAEEKLISNAISLSSKLTLALKEHIIIVNHRDQLVFNIKSKLDFYQLKDYFIKNISGSGYDFNYFLEDNSGNISVFTNIYIFTLEINEKSVKVIHRLANRKNLILLHNMDNIKTALARFDIKNININNIEQRDELRWNG